MMRISAPLACCFLALTAAGGVSAQTTPSADLPLVQKDERPAPVEEVRRLAREGQTTKALARADEALAANPRDAQLRFVRAVLLADLKRTAESKAAFEQMIEDFPELPEPYNNLAAIVAAEGRLARAEQLLKSALDANPTFATAHENLGDLYLRMAADSYAQAAKLAPANRGVAAKLAQVRELAGRAPKR